MFIISEFHLLCSSSSFLKLNFLPNVSCFFSTMFVCSEINWMDNGTEKVLSSSNAPLQRNYILYIIFEFQQFLKENNFHNRIITLPSLTIRRLKNVRRRAFKNGCRLPHCDDVHERMKEPSYQNWTIIVRRVEKELLLPDPGDDL